MSNRQGITAHFLIRWLQRVEHIDIDMLRSAMQRDGLNHEDDGELVYFIGTNIGLDIDRLRQEMLQVVYPAICARAKSVLYKGYRIVISDGSAVTVIPSGKRHRRRWA